MQLPDPGMLPMPKEYTPPPTEPKVPQELVPGGVAVSPAGMVTLPALMLAATAFGLVNVRVIVAFAPGATDVGVKDTVIDTAPLPVPVSARESGLVDALLTT